jgi:hypothetical protein
LGHLEAPCDFWIKENYRDARKRKRALDNPYFESGMDEDAMIVVKTLGRIVRRVPWEIKHEEKVEEWEHFVRERNGGLGKDERSMYRLLMNKMDDVGLINCFRSKPCTPDGSDVPSGVLLSAHRETKVWQGGPGLADRNNILLFFLSRAPADFQAHYKITSIAQSSIEDNSGAISTIWCIKLERIPHLRNANDFGWVNMFHPQVTVTRVQAFADVSSRPVLSGLERVPDVGSWDLDKKMIYRTSRVVSNGLGPVLRIWFNRQLLRDQLVCETSEFWNPSLYATTIIRWFFGGIGKKN